MNLVHELSDLLGTDAVSASGSDLDRHSHDVWPHSTKQAMRGLHPNRPDAIVRASDAGQVARLLAWANRRGIPVTPWGLGSSVTGASLPLNGGVTLDLSGLGGVRALDEEDLTVTVGAGSKGDELEAWLGDRGYTLGHSPQSLDRSTVGGWVATRATGQFSSRYGGIEDLVVGYTVVLADGTTVRLPEEPRQAVGPDPRQVFMGAEGTLGVITDVRLKIFPSPAHRLLETVRFPDVPSGLDAMRRITRAGLRPFLVRFYDADEARHVLGDAAFEGCVMFLGSEATAAARAVAEAEQSAAITICRAAGGTPTGPEAAAAWMDRRYDFSTIEGVLNRPGGYAETIEIAHFWSGIEAVHADLKERLAPLAHDVLGHFSHVYPQGVSLYVILLGQAADDAAATERIEAIWATAMRVALEHGAALSHHHGVGIARLPYVREALGDAMVVLERLKSALDPAGVLNPGKLGLPAPARTPGR